MKKITFIFLVILYLTSCQESPIENSLSEVTMESESNYLVPPHIKYETLFAVSSTLTPEEKQRLFECLYSLGEKYPELDEVILYIMRNRGPLTFKINPKLEGYAAYDFFTIEFKGETYINDETVLEEILHVAQGIDYGYELMNECAKNVEFEVRVLRDIWELRRYNRDLSQTYTFRGGDGGEYNAWLAGLSLGNLFLRGVPNFNKYAQEWYESGYNDLPFDPDFNPSFLKTFVGN